MGDIISNIIPLDLTIGEIAKTSYRASELEYDLNGVGVIIINSQKEIHALQAKHEGKFSENESKPDTPTIDGNVIIISPVVPKGKFLALYVRDGIFLDFEEEVTEEKEEE